MSGIKSKNLGKSSQAMFEGFCRFHNVLCLRIEDGATIFRPSKGNNFKGQAFRKAQPFDYIVVPFRDKPYFVDVKTAPEKPPSLSYFDPGPGVKKHSSTQRQFLTFEKIAQKSPIIIQEHLQFVFYVDTDKIDKERYARNFTGTIITFCTNSGISKKLQFPRDFYDYSKREDISSFWDKKSGPHFFIYDYRTLDCNLEMKIKRPNFHLLMSSKYVG